MINLKNLDVLELISESGQVMTIDTPNSPKPLMNNALMTVLDNGPIMDFYLIPESLYFHPVYFDIMSDFGKSDNPHVPQFKDIGQGELWSYGNKQYKVYVAPKYHIKFTEHDRQVMKDLNRQRRKKFDLVGHVQTRITGKTNLSQTDTLIHSLTLDGHIDSQHVEAMLEIIRVIGLTESNIMPRFVPRRFRTDNAGNLVFFNVFQKVDYA